MCIWACRLFYIFYHINFLFYSTFPTFAPIPKGTSYGCPEGLPTVAVRTSSKFSPFGQALRKCKYYSYYFGNIYYNTYILLKNAVFLVLLVTKKLGARGKATTNKKFKIYFILKFFSVYWNNNFLSTFLSLKKVAKNASTLALSFWICINYIVIPTF